MIRERWSDVDITAYLDGQLEPERIKDFKFALAQNSILRQRVDAMRKTIALLRETPLREAPRNYLLTPSMVANPKPARQVRRWPIGFMRVATSLTAAAFVLTMGLNVLNHGLAPTFLMDQSESLELAQHDGAMEKEISEAIILEEEERVLTLSADTPPTEIESSEERGFAVEEPAEEPASIAPEAETEIEAAELLEIRSEDAEGGGEALPEAPVVEQELKVASEADVESDSTTGLEGEAEKPSALDVAEGPDMTEDESFTGTVEGDAQELVPMDEFVETEDNMNYAVEEDTPLPLSAALEGDAISAAPPDESKTEVVSPTGDDKGISTSLLQRIMQFQLPQWLPVSLGILTVALFVITTAMSIRRR